MVLIVERRAPIVQLTVDRPAVKNAISLELAEALVAALEEAERDEAISVVVLASSSRDVFLSGGDLNELAALPMDASGAAAVAALGSELAAIERSPLPVVAAVEGRVIGGGAELLLLCDLCVMAESARCAFVHARMGLTPAWGGTSRLIERVGAGRASDLLLSSRELEAREALAMGIAQRVVDDGHALEAARELAAELAGRPRSALTAVKRSLLAVREARRGAALDAEGKVFRSAWGSEPHLAAFGARSRKR